MLDAAQGGRDGARRILAVEDDPDLLRLIGRELTGAGFEVWPAPTAERALELVGERGLPHLAVVDKEETVVDAIKRFAEDYIVKPFSPREMVARVERVLRRIGDFAYTLAPVVPVDGRLAVDFAHQRALVDGRPVPLTATETKLLYVLLRSAGRVVETPFLLRRLWPVDEVYEDTLRVHIHRLRGKIEPTPARPRYIVTERGAGYRFPLPAPQRPPGEAR
jgi:DNA-binding response OmpR family regulator